ncbi:phosphatidylinositol transfer protein csr1, partial [Teratosphaeriaceae sp. CCFEE 6253]
MASHNLPGRPGNLTPEQAAKLKDMWAATLDVFGVAHDERASLEFNGTSTPSTDDTSSEPKKKH